MKIIGIGLPKTGTTTLKTALLELGFNNGGVYKFGDPKAEVFVGDYNCLPLDKYKQYDKTFPDAKFILTLRESPEVWYNSVERWAEKHKDYEALKKQRKSMYGYEMPEREPFVSHYIRHAESVYKYFRDKYRSKDQEKLLIVCWEFGDGWNELCEFLRKPVPDIPFPHKNKNK